MIRDECASRGAGVEERTPTVTFTAIGPGGAARSDVRVFVGDRLVAERTDGTAVWFDPGEHRFVFQAPDGQTREVTVRIEPGVRDQQVSADFRGATTPPPAQDGPEPEADSGGSWAPWIVGIVGLSSLAMFGLFAGAGKLKEDELFEECAPNCAQADVDDMRRRYLVADVFLVMGAAAVVTAGIWLLVQAGDSDPTDEEPEDEPRSGFRIAPTAALADGAVGLGVSGTF